ALVRPALDRLPAGGVLALLSTDAALGEDLPRWCRSEKHVYLGRRALPEGRTEHLVERGTWNAPPPREEVELRPDAQGRRSTQSRCRRAPPSARRSPRAARPASPACRQRRSRSRSATASWRPTSPRSTTRRRRASGTPPPTSRGRRSRICPSPCRPRPARYS